MIKLFVLFIVLSAAVMLPAAPKVEGLSDLKKLQTKVQRVVREKTKTTVSLISPTIGASGSGVIVSSDGLILTAAHVIERSKEMTVIFPDGRQEKAKVLGANFTRDAAMAKLIGPGPWPFAEIGDSKSLEVGDFVVAMGHPKGYDPTRRPPVRFGRVMDKGNLDFVTTDCTLIGGDSGGPLFDLEGRVVGIHSHIAPDRRVNNHAGLSGFKNSWENMLAGKSWGVLGGDRRDPNRPVLGLNLRKTDLGLVVDEVPRGGPASAAGFLPGDFVISINGELITEVEKLSEIFVDLLPGEEVKVDFSRGGSKLTKTVKLARLGDIYLNERR
ncbi:MAG: trypsin-like peptidase domain-containing protein [Akkermansiaceae bacterium]|nr:trypsin-like peptidase domain-containing protein [Akkermansiaceae bacterium]